jgi:hypothetical protein
MDGLKDVPQFATFSLQWKKKLGKVGSFVYKKL